MHFIFDDTLNKPIDGVVMGSTLGPELANAFLIYHETNWPERCPLKYRPFYYQKYVDDIFVLCNSPEHIKHFQIYLNSRHVNIFFTIENEKDDRISPLKVNIIREQVKFTTSAYPKPTFSGILLILTVFPVHLQNCHDSHITISMFPNLLRFD